MIRLLPPLVKDAHTGERDPDHSIAVGGLAVYVAVVAAVIALINID